jgi:hypothetical protein
VNPSFASLYDKTEVIEHQPAATSELAQGDFASSAFAGGGRVSFSMPLGADLSAEVSQTLNFTLTPHTLVTFNGQMQGAVSGNIPDWAGPNGYFDWAYIDLSGGARMSASGGGSSTNTFKYLGARSSTPGYSTDQSADTALSVILANSKGVPLVGTLAYTIDASGHTMIPSVPEASTWAQMLLGTGLMGALVCRRKRLPARISG